MSKTPLVYDVYVLKTSGIPLVSGCTETEYCIAHMDQHELQSGFLAALNSFSQEAFDNENIRTLEMENIQLNFKVNKDKELIFAAISPISINREDLHLKLAEGMDKFIEKFGDHLQKLIAPQLMFEDFKPILKEIGIIEEKFRSSYKAQKVENSKKTRLLKWINSLKS